MLGGGLNRLEIWASKFILDAEDPGRFKQLSQNAQTVNDEKARALLLQLSCWLAVNPNEEISFTLPVPSKPTLVMHINRESGCAIEYRLALARSGKKGPLIFQHTDEVKLFYPLQYIFELPSNLDSHPRNRESDIVKEGAQKEHTSLIKLLGLGSVPSSLIKCIPQPVLQVLYQVARTRYAMPSTIERTTLLDYLRDSQWIQFIGQSILGPIDSTGSCQRPLSRYFGAEFWRYFLVMCNNAQLSIEDLKGISPSFYDDMIKTFERAQIPRGSSWGTEKNASSDETIIDAMFALFRTEHPGILLKHMHFLQGDIMTTLIKRNLISLESKFRPTDFRIWLVQVRGNLDCLPPKGNVRLEVERKFEYWDRASKAYTGLSATKVNDNQVSTELQTLIQYILLRDKSNPQPKLNMLLATVSDFTDFFASLVDAVHDVKQYVDVTVILKKYANEVFEKQTPFFDKDMMIAFLKGCYQASQLLKQEVLPTDCLPELKDLDPSAGDALLAYYLGREDCLVSSNPLTLTTTEVYKRLCLTKDMPCGLKAESNVVQHNDLTICFSQIRGDLLPSAPPVPDPEERVLARPQAAAGAFGVIVDGTPVVSASQHHDVLYAQTRALKAQIEALALTFGLVPTSTRDGAMGEILWALHDTCPGAFDKALRAGPCLLEPPSVETANVFRAGGGNSADNLITVNCTLSLLDGCSMDKIHYLAEIPAAEVGAGAGDEAKVVALTISLYDAQGLSGIDAPCMYATQEGRGSIHVTSRKVINSHLVDLSPDLISAITCERGSGEQNSAASHDEVFSVTDPE